MISTHDGLHNLGYQTLSIFEGSMVATGRIVIKGKSGSAGPLPSRLFDDLNIYTTYAGAIKC
jgi:hypothetical protein